MKQEEEKSEADRLSTLTDPTPVTCQVADALADVLAEAVDDALAAPSEEAFDPAGCIIWQSSDCVVVM